ncbi:sphingolipid delta-4 desaturase [Coemansia spiralis]|uniref:Sphingolipid delta-4 desaturase n=2 Tax=Coemansia TaxID=4863 RepID=A0A9W8L0R4_9FUNG|nr:sphingolipid delta-4 desaturase [Coemansia umbellata]KAJ2623634.1 sphingolipid delta-4 desaturase [Coemansia sp. RSA 1358]KAJ2680304.1 sphingolipid delta-4 desaturase [Coemansia spiralis]
MPPHDTSSPEAVQALHKDEQFDMRFPSYLGFWKRSVPGLDEQPRFDMYDEPHRKRKQQILQDHPEIETLYGYDTSSIWITLTTVCVQMLLAYTFGRVLTDWNWTMVLVAYAIGGSISTQIGIIFHEFTHNLCAATTLQNRWVGNIGNIPLVVPLAQSFRRYHLEHHTYQGVYGYDPDLPLEWEIRLIGNDPVRKFFWLIIYGIMYIGRGLAQQKQLSRWELINWAWSFACDFVIIKVCGWRGMLYLVLSVLLGFGLHPGAAHFIQEHYTFRDGQETYSYYGSGNTFWLNIGYHNEHHDFPLVPWTKLPEIKRMAPEYYDNLACHTSWWAVLYMFVTSSLLAPQSRVVRTIDAHRYARKNLRVPTNDEAEKIAPEKDALVDRIKKAADMSMEKARAFSIAKVQ